MRSPGNNYTYRSEGENQNVGWSSWDKSNPVKVFPIKLNFLWLERFHCHKELRYNSVIHNPLCPDTFRFLTASLEPHIAQPATHRPESPLTWTAQVQPQVPSPSMRCPEHQPGSSYTHGFEGENQNVGWKSWDKSNPGKVFPIKPNFSWAGKIALSRRSHG